jgi:hypothetical protein
MENFYVRLFELDASVKPLFAKTNMAKQALATGNTISAAVDGLDDLPALVPVLQVCAFVLRIRTMLSRGSLLYPVRFNCEYSYLLLSDNLTNAVVRVWALDTSSMVCSPSTTPLWARRSWYGHY